MSQARVEGLVDPVAEEAGKQGHIALEKAYEQTEQLISGLKSLNHNIKRYIEIVLKEKKPQEILKIHFEDYKQEILDRSYHRLKTSDNVSKYRPRIIRRISEWYENDLWVAEIAAADVRRGRFKSIDEAKQDAYRRLDFIRQSYLNMDGLLEEIDRRNAQYANSSFMQIRYILNSSRDTEGQLLEILKYLAGLLKRPSYGSWAMMDWVAEYEGFTAGQREDFRRIVNKLLAQTYITKRKEDQRRDYYFVERHESMIRTYLGMSGWDLIGDKGLGVYQAVNHDGFNRLQLRLQESIILLLVRLCYEERRRELTLAENVVIRVREIQEKYAALQIRDRPIDKKGLRDAIALMKRFNIVDVLDRNPVDPDCRLVLFPSILLAVRVDDIRQVYEKLTSYRSAGREVAEDDVGGDEAAEGDVAGDRAADDDGDRASVLLTGDNGTGKSTILDAIQYVLVADLRQVRFNVSAHEETRRDLLGYLCCKTGIATDNGERSLRQGDITSYVALEFHDRSKDEDSIVGAAMDSYADGMTYKTNFFKIEKQRMADDLFLAGRRPRNIREFKVHIKGYDATVYPSVEQYREDLLMKLGSLGERFFSFLVKAISFKPITDIRQFVYSYVLDKKHVNIDIMRENFERYREYSDLVEQTKAKIAKKEAEEEFKEHFVYRLKENIETAQMEFGLLNDALKQVEFRDDRYHFMATPSIVASFLQLYRARASEQAIRLMMFDEAFNRLDALLDRYERSAHYRVERPGNRRVSLFVHLQKSLGIDLRPYRMDLDTLIQYERFARPLPKGYAGRLRRLLADPDFEWFHSGPRGS